MAKLLVNVAINTISFILYFHHTSKAPSSVSEEKRVFCHSGVGLRFCQNKSESCPIHKNFDLKTPGGFVTQQWRQGWYSWSESLRLRCQFFNQIQSSFVTSAFSATSRAYCILLLWVKMFKVGLKVSMSREIFDAICSIPVNKILVHCARLLPIYIALITQWSATEL